MRIKNLEVENFKLFDKKFDSIKDVSKADLILLNGPNGYGKTSVFDALEFALTGEIKRINTYSDELGVAKNEKYNKKILVADPSKEAYVMLTLEDKDCELKIVRFYEKSLGKKPSIDNNPYKIFEKFKRKLFVNGEEIVQEEEQKNILKKYHLDNIKEFFDKCCFLSQDEHLQFLKETKKDKPVALEFMFELPEKQKKELEKLKKISYLLKNGNTKKDLGYIKKLEILQEEISKEIEKLEKKVEEQYTEQGEKREYQFLFPGKRIKWDEKNPMLAENEFVNANKEIDNLLYYAKHQEACIAYVFNRPILELIKPFYGGENITYKEYSLEYAYRYYPLLQNGEIIEKKYNKQQQLEQLLLNLENREIHKINWEVVYNEKLMEDDSIVLVKEELEHIKDLKKIQGSVSKVITSITETRKVLLKYTGEAVEQSFITDKECPLCGAVYDNKKIFEEKILKEEQKLLQLSNGTSKDIQDRIDGIYKKYLNVVLKDVQVRLQDRISETIYKKYLEVKKNKANLKKIEEILEKIYISLPKEYEEDITEISRGYGNFIESIHKNLMEIPEEVKEQLDAKEFLGDYDRYYDSDINKFREKTESILQAKHEYVKNVFYDYNKKLIYIKREELKKIQKRYKKLEEIYSELWKYKEAIEEGIKEYKRSVIRDIEPLLHVYTGKILQKKFCGKSIFILTDEDMSNFQLIHSTEDNHDILYNMSSGQLAAVSISFLLCMNKVYAQQQSLPILLIDDPVQTIDDVNMVGLVDILRFEFEGTQVFISTHEQKFEWYLKYKYEKANKKIESYNMKKIILQREDFHE